MMLAPSTMPYNVLDLVNGMSKKDIYSFVDSIKIKLLTPEGKKFLITGTLIVIAGNILLQILLRLTNTLVATFLAQLISSIMGYITYGRVVFPGSCLTVNKGLKFYILGNILWVINSSGISIMEILGISKYIGAVLMIPILAIISFILQKRYIYKITSGQD